MRTLIGMITPSLNTVLEPVTYELLRDMPDVTAHFTRVSVTGISLDETSSAQFAPEPMLAAARLLMDAHVDGICWNGTSGGWIGTANDAKLCEEIAQETGVPTTSSTQATNELFRRAGVERFGLVTPYHGDVQEAIIANYQDSTTDRLLNFNIINSISRNFAGSIVLVAVFVLIASRDIIPGDCRPQRHLNRHK